MLISLPVVLDKRFWRWMCDVSWQPHIRTFSNVTIVMWEIILSDLQQILKVSHWRQIYAALVNASGNNSCGVYDIDAAFRKWSYSQCEISIAAEIIRHQSMSPLKARWLIYNSTWSRVIKCQPSAYRSCAGCKEILHYPAVAHSES